MKTQELIKYAREHTDCQSCQKYADMLEEGEHRGIMITEGTTELIIRSLRLHVIYQHSPIS